MKKERLLIAILMIALSTAILFTGVFGRISYETKSRYAFVATDMNELKVRGLDTDDYLQKLKAAGSHVVTVHPLTVKGLQKEGRLRLISYSSLFITQDVIFQQIQNALGNYAMKSESMIAVVTDPALQSFMESELSYRYTDYTNVFLEDGTTMVFAFQNLTAENDLVVGYDYKELGLIGQAGMKASVVYPSYSFENSVYPKYFKEFVKTNGVSFLLLKDNPYDNLLEMSEEMKTTLRNLDLTLVLTENENQIGNEMPYLSGDFFSVKKFNTVRGFYMDKIVPYDSTLYRYRYHQWFNSAIERNTVFIQADILKNPDVSEEENAELTLRAISDFTSNLRGYEISDHRPEIPYIYGEEAMAMAGGILLLSLLYLYLLIVLKKPLPYITEGYFGLMILTVILAYAFASFFTGLFALGIMVVGSSLMSALLFYLDKKTAGRKKLLWILLSTLAVSVCGVIAISALLGGIEFYVSNKLFRGVVLSLIFPLVMAVVNGYLIYYSDTVSLKEIPKILWERIKTINRWVIVSVGVFGLLFVAYYFIRSGKSDLLLPLEDNFRKWLSDTFYIRPRLKEFLFGYPAFAVFLYLSFQNKNVGFKYFFGVCTSILFTSIFNTFCHTFTAVTVSMHRVFNGFLCGLIVSLAVVGSILLIRYMIGYHKKNKEEKPKEEPNEEEASDETQTEPIGDTTEPMGNDEHNGEMVEAVREAKEEPDMPVLEAEIPAEQAPETETKCENTKNQKKNGKQSSRPQNPKYPVKKTSKKKKKSRKK